MSVVDALGIAAAASWSIFVAHFIYQRERELRRRQRRASEQLADERRARAELRAHRAVVAIPRRRRP